MTKLTKDDILGALPSLKKADLQAIATLALHLTGQKAKNAPAATLAPAEAYLFDTFTQTLGLKLAWVAFSQSSAHKDWAKNQLTMWEFTNKLRIAYGMNNKVQMLALMRYLFGLLVVDLRERRIVVSPQTVAQNMGRMPQVFDAAFPGYLASGLDHLVLKRLLGGNDV